MDGSVAATTSRTERTQILIVGTGFAGLGMAIRLRQQGITDFVVLEKDAGIGGTWRINNYPGCACDVQSHLYSFSFAPNPGWSRMFSPQAEIKAYLEGCVARFGLAPHLRLNTEMESASWDQARQLWRISTVGGKVYEAPVFIPAVGGLSRAAVPDIKGLKSFKGPVFHSQQWDHSVDLKGKRVAVIGTGASAIQFVPQIQPLVVQLDLYQRTPPWIMPKPDRLVSAWERGVFKRAPFAQSLVRGGLYTLMEARALAFIVRPKLMKFVGNVARRHIYKHIKNPALRKKLTPDYLIGCKRILISNDYYPALAQGNVEVITEGVQEVRAHSVVDAQGVERAVDVILLGTGFQATTPVPKGLFFGRDGRDLGEEWLSGAEAYKGTTIHGYPNLFMIVGPNTGLGHNSMIYMIESQIAYVLDALKTLQRNQLGTVEVKADVQARYNADLQQKHHGTIWEQGGCKSWYVHESGKNTSLWPGFTFQFRAATRRFDLGAYLMTPAHRPVAAAVAQ